MIFFLKLVKAVFCSNNFIVICKCSLANNCCGIPWLSRINLTKIANVGGILYNKGVFIPTVLSNALYLF